MPLWYVFSKARGNAKQMPNTKQNCFSDLSMSPPNNKQCLAIQPVLPLELSCLSIAADGKQNIVKTLFSNTFCREKSNINYKLAKHKLQTVGQHTFFAHVPMKTCFSY